MTEPSDSTATRSWVRHPSDLARLAMSLLALTAGLAVVATHPDLVRGVSSDLIRLVLRLPHGVRASLLGLTQLAAVLAPAALVGLLALHRRVRLAAIVLGAAGLAALVMVVLQRWLDGTVPSQVLERSEGQSWVSGAAFPSGTYLAALTAAVVVLTPLAGPAGRRAAWLGVFAAATCRLVTAVAVPVNLVVTVAIGAVVGSAVVAVVGAPRRRFSLDEVEKGVRRAGVEVDVLREVEQASSRRCFETTATVDHRSVPAVVTLLGRDDRNGDLVLRALRWIRTKGIDDAQLGWRPGGRSEHEAFTTMLAASTINAPEMLGVAETPAGDGVLVLSVPPGSPLADLGEVLTSTAALVGADRSVAAAVRSSTPRGDLEAALPLIQPAALSSATRRAIHGRMDLVADVRTGMQEAIGAEPVTLTELERIDKGKVLSTFGLVLLAAVVLAFASNASAIGEALGDMDASYLLPMASTVVISYLAGAWTLVGAVTVPLPFWRTVQVMLAQTTQPSKVVALLGGAAIMKLTSIAAFHLACAAFGISLSPPESALLFMTANTIASAAPTPGGIGAVEAALVAALTSTGAEPAAALGSVLVFRLVTFWAPVPPSWLALQQLRRAEAV